MTDSRDSRDRSSHRYVLHLERYPISTSPALSFVSRGAIRPFASLGFIHEHFTKAGGEDFHLASSGSI